MQTPTPHDEPTDLPQRPVPEDAEAADLLEVGIGPEPSRPRVELTLPSVEELSARFPDLEILEVVGQGGMGVVYRVRQRRLDRTAALKVLPKELSEAPAFTERFTREARALAKLQHPHIVGVYEFGEKEGVHFLLMEFVDGVTLRQLLETDSLSPKEALAIVPQICGALQYAHEKGVVHRDVKPENILLDRRGRVKVADFGLAKLAEHGPGDFTLTGTGQVMGTVHYMAPEQYKTPGDVDHRADIFSLGVVFYEMLTGDLPVGNFKRPSADSDLGERLDEIVLRALERERELRYQHASEVSADVKTVVSGTRVGVDADAVSAAAVPRPHARRGFRHWFRDPYDPERPLSRWTLLGLICLFASPVLGILVHWLVFVSNENTRSAHEDAGLGVAVVAGGVALALLVGAIFATAHRRPLLRGHRRSVLAALLMGLALFPASVELHSSISRKRHFELQRMNRAARDPRAIVPAKPWKAITVRGHAAGTNPDPLRMQIYLVWEQYLNFMRTGDATPKEGLRARYYSAHDTVPYRDLEGAALEQKVAAGELGLGVMGKGHLPSPPWEYRLRQITVDKWESEATVVAYRPYQGGTMEFKMKRVEGAWVFALTPPKVTPRAERPGK